MKTKNSKASGKGKGTYKCQICSMESKNSVDAITHLLDHVSSVLETVNTLIKNQKLGRMSTAGETADNRVKTPTDEADSTKQNKKTTMQSSDPLHDYVLNGMSMAQEITDSSVSHKSLSMLLLCLGFLISGLIWIPFTVGAVSSYNSGMPNPSTFIQLGAIMFVLVIMPIFLSYCLWKGYRLAWWLSVIFSCFNIVLYLITFSALKISLSTGPLISDSSIGPLGYAIGYGITYLGTYLLAVIAVILNLSLIYYLTRTKTKAYFGM